MKTLDLLKGWEEPTKIAQWGNDCRPPVAPAWEYFINVNSHPDDMSIFFRVIFPAFVEVGDCVLLKMNADRHSEDNLLDYRRQVGNSEIFEKQFNVFKVYDLFSHTEVEYESSFELAAHLLKQSWGHTLSLLFPDREFNILLSNSDQDYGPTLTVFSKR